MPYLRIAKGAVAVAVAVAVCHTLMTAGYTWARDSSAADEDTMFSGAFEFMLTTIASWALMPFLLRAGMRLMGETGNAVLVTVGGLAWAGLSGYFIDDMDAPGGHMPVTALAVYVLLGAGLAGVGSVRRD